MTDFRSTPQEAVLDDIFEAITDAGGSGNFYGVTDSRPAPILYIEDERGDCWQITATRHYHPHT